MRKLTIVGPDDKVALVEKLVTAIAEMEIVEVKDVDSIEEFQRKPPMERLDFAIRRIDSEEGVLVNRYDFAWLYAAVQEGKLKGIEKFKSVNSFRQRLKNIGIKKVPSNSTISCWYGYLRHKYPDWVFTDCDGTEGQRRINVAKRFLSLYNKGK
jgi:hypothetical protein